MDTDQELKISLAGGVIKSNCCHALRRVAVATKNPNRVVIVHVGDDALSILHAIDSMEGDDGAWPTRVFYPAPNADDTRVLLVGYSSGTCSLFL